MAERGIIFKDDFVTTPGKSWFDMSFDFLLSMNFGELTPTTCMECMPADVIHAKSDSFVRLAPLVAPTFGKVNMFNYHFYVRNRDIWTNWLSFITNADNKLSWQSSIGSSFTPPEMPYVDIFELCGIIASDNAWRNDNRDGHSYDCYSLAGNIKAYPQVDPDDPAIEIEYAMMSENVHYLVLFNDGDQWNGYISTSVFLPNEDYPCVIIPFLRNKNQDWLPDSGTKYNPFSPGSLFDYLGVDLSGYYLRQCEYFKTALTDLIDIIESPTDIEKQTKYFWPKNIVGYSYYPDSDVHLTFGQTGTFVPFDGDLETFLKKNLCFSITYSHNYQFSSVTASGNGLAENDEDAHASAVNALSYDSLVQDFVNGGKIESQCISTLPVRAYNFIYNEYFRDENYIDVNSNIDFARDGRDLGDPVLVNSIDIWRYFTLELKAYEHDPYTTALPQAQRGVAARFLPDTKLVESDSRTQPSGTVFKNIRLDSNGVYTVTGGTTTSSNNVTDIAVDLSAATIENFRFANACQRYLEKVARSGSRYYEYMKAIFGSDIPSEKLNRPIFLGGDKSPIQVSEVLQTSATEFTSEQPLGQMAGRAVSVGNDDYLEYVAPDHGFFIELCTILPRTNYQSGLNPMFTRQTYLDYPLPEFAQLGEEPVLQRELWFSADDSDQIPFGYQSRFYQHKYNRDRTAGSFKDDLDFWTWTRKFDNAPVQGREFIEVNQDYRQFAVVDKSVEHVYVHMWHDLQVNRSLPVFGMPSI